MTFKPFKGRVFLFLAGIVLLGVALTGVATVHAQVSIGNDGVTFPDNSVQTTATHTSYAIGDVGPAGGIVFYVTALGFHGLEAAPDDQTQATWGCYGTEIPGAAGTAIGMGVRNTADILDGCAERPIAASIANSYTLNGFSDWFLPSKDELNLMYQNLHLAGLGGFASSSYWSSSEANHLDAWRLYFTDGTPDMLAKLSTRRARAVRAF